jgi:hypothetical protein
VEANGTPMNRMAFPPRNRSRTTNDKETTQYHVLIGPGSPAERIGRDNPAKCGDLSPVWLSSFHGLCYSCLHFELSKLCLET